jgi:predicted transcriptional regulator
MSAANQEAETHSARQVAHIKEALAEDEEGGPGVPHEEVMQWLESWGTDHELPRPKPRKP